MIGLLYILFFLLFGFISSKIVRWTITWAKGKNKNPKLWGILAGLVMFSLVFWDLIPTYAAHRYYCHKDAGFTVNKTLEQWQQENPGAEEVIANTNEKDLISDSEQIYFISTRFKWQKQIVTKWFGIKQTIDDLIDRNNFEVLAKKIDYSMDIRPLGLGARNLRDYKVWLVKDSCFRKKDRETKWLVEGDSFISLKKKFKHLTGDTNEYK